MGGEADLRDFTRRAAPSSERLCPAAAAGWHRFRNTRPREGRMATHGNPRARPLGQLFSDLGRQLRELVTDEVALAKAEVREKADQVSGSARLFGLAVALAHAGGLTLVAAVVLGLMAAFALSAWVASLIVAVLLLAAAGGLFLAGRAQFRRRPLAPRQTIDSLKENVEWLKSHAR